MRSFSRNMAATRSRQRVAQGLSRRRYKGTSFVDPYTWLQIRMEREKRRQAMLPVFFPTLDEYIGMMETISPTWSEMSEI